MICGSHPNQSAQPILEAHGRKQGNGGTQEVGAIYSFETFPRAAGVPTPRLFFCQLLTARNDFVVGVVAKASVTPVRAIALQSKVKEKQADYGELLQHARADR